MFRILPVVSTAAPLYALHTRRQWVILSELAVRCVGSMGYMHQQVGERWGEREGEKEGQLIDRRA